MTENVERIENAQGATKEVNRSPRTPRVSMPELSPPDTVAVRLSEEHRKLEELRRDSMDRTFKSFESGRKAPPADEAASAETRKSRAVCTLGQAGGEKRGRARPAIKIGGVRMKMTKGMTVDSGAADNVIPRKMLRKGNKVRASRASRAGVYYVAADNGRIPNEGEVDFPFETKDGTRHNWTFQVANVNKVLAAVSAMVDSGHRVTFEKDMATGRDLSYIVNKTTGKVIKMRRDRNVWVIDTYVNDEGQKNDEPDFARQE